MPRAKRTYGKGGGPDTQDVISAVCYVEETWGVRVALRIEPEDQGLTGRLKITCYVPHPEHQAELYYPQEVARYAYYPDWSDLVTAMHNVVYDWLRMIAAHMAYSAGVPIDRD